MSEEKLDQKLKEMVMSGEISIADLMQQAFEQPGAEA